MGGNKLIKIVNQNRYQQVKKKIIEMIENEEISGNKLPSEDELSKLLGVSLATLREALLVLKGEGVITKRHGRGNFIHRSTLKTKMRIDRSVDFVSLLQDGGYEVSVDQSDFTKEKANEEDVAILNINAREKVIQYERKFFADGKLAMICYNRIAEKSFTKELKNVAIARNICDFIWQYCQKELAQGIIEFVPFVAREKERELFGIKVGTPMTAWREVFYTLDDEPICTSFVLFNPSIVIMKMLWKWGGKI
jgi:GntR family transcriptional regulator